MPDESGGFPVDEMPEPVAGVGIKSGISVGDDFVALFRSSRVGGNDPNNVTKVSVLNDGEARMLVWCKGHGGNDQPAADSDMFPLDASRSIPFEIEVSESSQSQIDLVIAKRATGTDTTAAVCVIRHR